MQQRVRDYVFENTMKTPLKTRRNVCIFYEVLSCKQNLRKGESLQLPFGQYLSYSVTL